MNIVLLLTLLAVPGGPDLSSFERVLLPMHGGSTAGARSSSWKVEEVIFNASDDVTRFYPYYPQPHPLFGPPEFGSLDAGKRLDALLIDEPQPCRLICPAPLPHPGAILWLERNRAQAAVVHDRVFEVNADVDNYGAIVPGVREESFRTGRTTFVDVPFVENFRTTLRVYNLSDVPLGITLRVYDAANATAVAQVLNVRPVHGAPLNGLPLIPGYAQIALDNIVPPASTDLSESS